MPPRKDHEVAAVVVAGGVAACLGLATYYLVRLMLSREPMTARPPLPSVRTDTEE